MTELDLQARRADLACQRHALAAMKAVHIGQAAAALDALAAAEEEANIARAIAGKAATVIADPETARIAQAAFAFAQEATGMIKMARAAVATLHS